MSDCTIAAQVLEKREEPAEYLVDRMIRICRDQLMLPIRQTMERIDCHEICFMESRGHNVYIYTKNREIRIYCFGIWGVLIGQKRLPIPPAMITI